MNTAVRKTKLYETYGVLLGDIFVQVLSYTIAMLIRYGSLRYFGFGSLHFNVCALMLLVTICYFSLANPSQNFIKRGYYLELLAVIKSNVVLFATMAIGLFLSQAAEDYSRLVSVYFVGINMVLMYVMHLILKKSMHKHFRLERNQTKSLLVTQKEYLDATVKAMLEHSDVSTFLNTVIVWDGASFSKEECEGIKDSIKEKIAMLHGGNKEDVSISVLFDRDEWIDSLRLQAIDEAFLYLPDVARKDSDRLMEELELMGMVCHYSVDYDDMNARIRRVGEYAGYTVVTYSLSDYDYRRNIFKRLLDIIGGLVGSLITLILFIFLAPAIKLDSPGPVFFKQTRIGRNGRKFTIYKFRSMCKNAEEMKKDMMDQNEAEGNIFKVKNDMRITRVGKFIRKTSLDEFPQFFNILKGDMSLVGTRPPLEDEFNRYTPYQKRRMCMTPGLTGLWQVSGRSDIKDFDEIVKLDLQYIDNWSWGLDIKILLKTLAVVFTGKGAE